MEMHAYTRTVSDLLSVKRKYIVPRFQREYSWTKEKVKELWEDILSNLVFSNEGITHQEYFIGALVLVGDETSNKMEIVDGQQRLTTLTILLAVLCHKFNELNKKELAEAIYNNYIAGKDDDGLDYFKLQNETPKPFFQTNIQHITRASVLPETNEEKTLLTAYNDIYSFTSERNLKKLLPKAIIDNDDDHINILKKIRDQVTSHLKVIYITVKEEEEAYTIFETLNARGMNLTFVDLIKNRLFKTLNSKHPDDDVKTKWKEIRDVIGSRSGLSIEVFVRHWWISKYSYVSADNIYKNFNNKWKSGEIEATSFINTLSEAAKSYRMISAPEETDFPEQNKKEIYRSLTSFKVFGVSQHRPFLMSLFKAYSKKHIKLKKLESTLLYLENFHFMFNAVCSMRASGIEGTYSKSARDLASAKNIIEANEVIDALMKRLKEKAPDEELFEKEFSTLRFVNGYTKDKSLIQYIFRGIEHNNKPNKEFKVHNITLEHILSQSDGTEAYLGYIGNLLPLGEVLNGKAANKNVSDKVAHYKCSDYSLASTFSNEYSNKYKSTWGKKEIEDRTKELSKQCYKIWGLQK